MITQVATGSEQQTQDTQSGQQQDHSSASQTEQTQATQQTEVAKPVKPEGLADDFWDAERGVKVDAVLGKLGELTAAQQAEADRRAALPKSAADYKVELPADFKMPDGWQIDTADKSWSAFADFAHKRGMSQDDFAQGAKLITEMRLNEAAARVTAASAEFAKLGDNGKVRVTAVHTFLDSAFSPEQSKAIKASLINSDAVAGWEKMQGLLTSSGITTFNHSGRDGGEKPGQIAGYENMTFEQRMAASEAQSRKRA